MEKTLLFNRLEKILKNMPSDWLELTTHRLDIYNESLAKTEFLDELEALVSKDQLERANLEQLATAYDYIRLGHPLSSVFEWALADMKGLHRDRVISFSSRVMPLMAILRKNTIDGKNTTICFSGELPIQFEADLINRVYGYKFELLKVEGINEIPSHNGSTVFISVDVNLGSIEIPEQVDFYLSVDKELGSVIFINGEANEPYISAIQHVRRRESIAMTPADCKVALERLIGLNSGPDAVLKSRKETVLDSIADITHSKSKAVIGSSGLSVQYALVMGLIDDAMDNHPGKDIKILVPPNCYGGTNDQARRVAESLSFVEVLDLPVDGENDMVSSVDRVLDEVARMDAVPFIIVEIPTNPRVEVPNLDELKNVLQKKRSTPSGNEAIEPIFIIDQTFCPNVNFLGEGQLLSDVKTIAYVSGSKFPSGGKCTAGYCVSNAKASQLMPKIDRHMALCDNGATNLQIKILAEQMPSMNQRIHHAYLNTREFVNYIERVLPKAKINFVSEELAERGFTPSVFSLDLPTKGDTEVEREAYKRSLNHKLIEMMISALPNESKYCVSYGQLKGCYWTIPATSTQGTTKEGDKDYIARVSVSPDLDLEGHKAVFAKFVEEIVS